MPHNNRISYMQASIIQNNIHGFSQTLFFFDFENRSFCCCIHIHLEVVFQIFLCKACKNHNQFRNSFLCFCTAGHDCNGLRKITNPIKAVRRKAKLFMQLSNDFIHFCFNFSNHVRHLTVQTSKQSGCCLLSPAWDQINFICCNHKGCFALFEKGNRFNGLGPESFVEVNNHDCDICKASSPLSQARKRCVARRVNKQQSGNSKGKF